MRGCAGDPRTRWTEGDKEAVKKFQEYLMERERADMSTPETPDPTPDPGPLELPKPVKP